MTKYLLLALTIALLATAAYALPGMHGVMRNKTNAPVVTVAIATGFPYTFTMTLE
jgi:hypothetical protein